jgi:hypothetical protein
MHGSILSPTAIIMRWRSLLAALIGPSCAKAPPGLRDGRARSLMSDEDKMKEILLSYVGLMAERNAFAPGDNFEYVLWDDLHGQISDTKYVSVDEGMEIIFLATQTESWVTYNDETRMFELIDLDEWEALVKKRNN